MTTPKIVRGEPVTMLETATFDEIVEQLLKRYPELIVIALQNGKTPKDNEVVLRRWKGSPQAIIGHIEMIRLKVLKKIDEIGA